MINNRFNILKLLGRGRSSVFLCTDSTIPGKEFAIKVISGESEEDELKSFRNEYYLLKKLDHPGIVAAYNYGTVLTLTDDESETGIETGDEFIILEYFAGNELTDIFTPEEDILKQIILQISSALYYLHQSNYVYYDLKPENILVRFVDGELKIKFIDFGFARHIQSTEEFVSRGTKEYMAPEVIKKEPLDHRTDLYSLGILLYRMVYGKFPFDTENDLQIFKSHLSGVFEFPATDYFIPIDTVVKKLLSKNPSDRYYTTVQLLSELEIDYADSKKEWNFVPSFAGRSDVIQKLKNYLTSDASGEIKVITGMDGIGKTELLNYVEYNQNDIVKIESPGNTSGADFAVHFIRQIIYTDFIFENLDESLIQYIGLHITPGTKDLISQVKSIISKISGQINFSLIIDDIDVMDQFALEILQNLLPILQSNGIHIILAEKSGSGNADAYFNNCDEIKLLPFLDNELENFIDSSYAAFFPKDHLIALIKGFIEPVPGEIMKFISNLIFLKIIDFKFDGPEISYTEREKEGLKNSFKEIFNNILADCTFNEHQYLKIIASLNNSFPETVIDKLTETNELENQQIVDQLRIRNILQKSVRSINPEFVSVALKEYVLNSIKDKEKFHREVALKLEKIDDENLYREIALQFENSGSFEEAFKYYNKMIEQAEALTALSTQKYLLEKVMSFELPDSKMISILLRLTKVLASMGDFKNCLKITESALKMDLTSDQSDLLRYRRAFALSNTGELEKSKEILEHYLEADFESAFYFELRLELSRIELKLNKYERTKELCNEILTDLRSDDFYKGQASNILGLMSIYKDQDPKAALKHFDETLNYYEKANNMVQIAAIEVNIGNIHSMLQNDAEAKKHWSRALQINQSIGNVEQEANILMNTGIFFFKNFNYEKAIENYKRALSIFLGTGNKFGNGLAHSNLCEGYLQICEYSNAMRELTKAETIFSEIKAQDELAELKLYKAVVYFSLNSIEYLEKTVFELESIVKTIDNERIKKVHKFSVIMLGILRQSLSDQSMIDDLIIYLVEQEDANNALRLFEYRLKFLLMNKEYSKAVKFANNEDFGAIFNGKIAEAWQHYFLAVIADKYPEGTPESEIYYLNNALNLIEDESITELTINVIVKLCEYYVKRGNRTKAKTYAEYFKSLYKLISDNIPNAVLKTNYSQKAEIRRGVNLIETLKTG